MGIKSLLHTYTSRHLNRCSRLILFHFKFKKAAMSLKRLCMFNYFRVCRFLLVLFGNTIAIKQTRFTMTIITKFVNIQRNKNFYRCKRFKKRKTNKSKIVKTGGIAKLDVSFMFVVVKKRTRFGNCL